MYTVRLRVFSFDEEQGGPHAKTVELSDTSPRRSYPQWHRTLPILGWLQNDQTIWYDMATGAETTSDETSKSKEPIPMMQRILDNPFLLLFLGVTMPTVFYILWGLMELTQIPAAN